MNSFNSLVNKNLGWVHENKYVFPIVSLILGMYAALARPKLPKFIEKLFNNPIFRLVMISYIIYRGNKDPQLAVMIASAFLITMHMINKRQVKDLEKLSNQSDKEKVAADAAKGGGPVTVGSGTVGVSVIRPGNLKISGPKLPPPPPPPSQDPVFKPKPR